MAVDVYRIQMSMNLGGSLAPELAKILRSMQDIDKAAKSVEKALGRIGTPVDRAVSSMARFSREMGNAQRSAARVDREMTRVGRSFSGFKAPTAGLDRDMQRWAAAMGRPLAEMRTMRSATQGVASAARGVSRSLDSWASRITSATAAMRRMQAAAASVQIPNMPPRVGGGSGSGGFAPGGAGRGGRGGTALQRRRHGRQFGEHEGSHLAGTMGVYGGINTVEYLIDQGAGAARENIRAKNAGLTPEEVAKLRAEATEQSKKYPSLSPLSVREQGRLLIPNVGSYDNAMKVLPEYLKGQVAIQTVNGPEKGAKDMEAFARFADVIGRSMSVEDTSRLIDGFVRALQLDAEAVRSNDYVNAAKAAAAPGKGLNVDFWTRIAPALMSQQGGARTGTDLASAYQNTAIGRGTNESLFAQNRSGWRVGFKSHVGKSGKQVIDNKGSLIDEALYNANPYEWTKKIVVPEMVKSGMLPKGYATGDYSEDLTDKQRADSGKFLSERFSNRRGANIISMMIQDMDQMEQYQKRWAKTRGTADVLSDQAKDPYVAGKAIPVQGGRVATALSSPAMDDITAAAGRIAATLGNVADTLEKHPVAAQTGFGLGAATVGGAAAAGVTALTLAAVGTLSLPALAVGSVAALTIGALTIPWGDIRRGMGISDDLWTNNGRVRGQGATPGSAKTPPKVGAFDFTPGLPTEAAPGAKVMPTLPPVPPAPEQGWWDWAKDRWNGNGRVGRAGGHRAGVAPPPTMPPLASDAPPLMGAGGAGGASAAIKQAGDALGQAGTAASSAAPGLSSSATSLDAAGKAASAASGGFNTAATGANAAAAAASGAGGALAALAGRISAMGSIGLPGGAKPVGGAPGATTPAPAASGGGAGGAGGGAPPAAPGRSSSVVPPRSGTPVQVAITTRLNDRVLAKEVTRVQVAENDYRRGTGRFNPSTLQTPVGYTSPIAA